MKSSQYDEFTAVKASGALTSLFELAARAAFYNAPQDGIGGGGGGPGGPQVPGSGGLSASPPPPQLAANRMAPEEMAKLVLGDKDQWLKLRVEIERSGFLTSVGIGQVLHVLVRERVEDMQRKGAFVPGVGSGGSAGCGGLKGLPGVVGGGIRSVAEVLNAAASLSGPASGLDEEAQASSDWAGGPPPLSRLRSGGGTASPLSPPHPPISPAHRAGAFSYRPHPSEPKRMSFFDEQRARQSAMVNRYGEKHLIDAVKEELELDSQRQQTWNSLGMEEHGATGPASLRSSITQALKRPGGNWNRLSEESLPTPAARAAAAPPPQQQSPPRPAPAPAARNVGARPAAPPPHGAAPEQQRPPNKAAAAPPPPPQPLPSIPRLPFDSSHNPWENYKPNGVARCHRHAGGAPSSLRVKSPPFASARADPPAAAARDGWAEPEVADPQSADWFASRRFGGEPPDVASWHLPGRDEEKSGNAELFDLLRDASLIQDDSDDRLDGGADGKPEARSEKKPRGDGGPNFGGADGYGRRTDNGLLWPTAAGSTGGGADEYGRKVGSGPAQSTSAGSRGGGGRGASRHRRSNGGARRKSSNDIESRLLSTMENLDPDGGLSWATSAGPRGGSDGRAARGRRKSDDNIVSRLQASLEELDFEAEAEGHAERKDGGPCRPAPMGKSGGRRAYGDRQDNHINGFNRAKSNDDIETRLEASLENPSFASGGYAQQMYSGMSCSTSKDSSVGRRASVDLKDNHINGYSRRRSDNDVEVPLGAPLDNPDFANDRCAQKRDSGPSRLSPTGSRCGGGASLNRDNRIDGYKRRRSHDDIISRLQASLGNDLAKECAQEMESGLSWSTSAGPRGGSGGPSRERRENASNGDRRRSHNDFNGARRGRGKAGIFHPNS